MSAIWGFIRSHSKPPINNQQHTEITEYYKTHCLLDKISHLNENHIYMGCGHQFITKESCHEMLPCHVHASNIYMDADCILDNRNELLRLLGETDPLIPDGTLLTFAYAKWGIECLSYLRGIFSFVIYDCEEEVTYLVTDQLSSRCLYYYYNEGEIASSTLLTPLTIMHPNTPLIS